MGGLMHYVELFSGAGGGILAHSVLGGHTAVAASEIAQYPRQVLAQRIADGALPPLGIYGDIAKVNGRDFRGIDMLTGGFPCQGLSSAGRQLRLNDPRTKLIWEMLRVAEESNAEYIFAENSDRLRSVLHLIVPRLQKIGYYSIAWCVVGAHNFGAFHQRKRMWLLARRSGPPFIYGWPGAPKKNPACGVLHGSSLLPLTSEVVGGPRISSASLLPTLICSDARASGNRPGEGGWSLSDRLGITGKAKRTKQLPTLLASDWRPPWRGQRMLEDLDKRARPLRGMLPVYTTGKYINPPWAEWFMGWPAGWTDLHRRFGKREARAWGKLVSADQWWSPGVEAQVLPATLWERKDVPFQKERITALGNGQVPVVAHRVCEGLMRLI